MPEIAKKKSAIWKILAIAFILLVCAIVAVPFLIDANQFRPKLESEIAGALGRDVKIGNLRIALLSGGVAADDISIGDDARFGNSPFVRAKSLQVGVELRPLILSKVVHINGIKLEQPEINLIRSKEGEWNFSSLGVRKENASGKDPADVPSGSVGSDVSIRELSINDGRISVLRGGSRAKPRLYDKVNIKASDLSFDSAFPFSLTAVLPGGGSAKVDGKAGPVNRADTTLTPLSAKLAVTKFDLVASGFIEPNSGLSGIVDFNGDVDSDGSRIASKGVLNADKLQIVQGGSPATRPISLNYAADYHVKEQSGTIRETMVEFGKAVARLNGSFDLRGESAEVKLKLKGEGMPANDLEALLPAIAVTLPKGASLEGGTLNADLSADGPIEKIVTAGTLTILGTRLAGFDLGAKMAAISSLAGIKSNSVTEIEKFASELKLAPDGIRIDGLTLIVPAIGILEGEGTVSSASALDFRMTARLNSSKGVLGQLSALTGAKSGGELAIPFFIRGTTSSPSFVPDAKGAAQNILKSQFKGTNAGQDNLNQKLGDTLRGLFGKKKK